jgi:membrane protein YqaA with SNARE-associated domain
MIPLEEFVRTFGWLGLFGASFISSTIIPLSTDALALVAMALGMSTVGVVGVVALAATLGGFTTYLLGRAGNFCIRRKIKPTRLRPYEKAIARGGVPLIFVAALTPIPYEPFAVGAGILRMGSLPFLISTFAGRLVRFFLIGYVKKGFELAQVGEFGLVAMLFGMGLVLVSIIIWYSWRLLRELKRA